MRCGKCAFKHWQLFFSMATSPSRVFARIHAIFTLVNMSNKSKFRGFESMPGMCKRSKIAVKISKNVENSIKATRIEYALKTCIRIVEFELAESNITVKTSNTVKTGIYRQKSIKIVRIVQIRSNRSMRFKASYSSKNAPNQSIFDANPLPTILLSPSILPQTLPTPYSRPLEPLPASQPIRWCRYRVYLSQLRPSTPGRAFLLSWRQLG
jgi:hypothetical protein